MTRSPNTERIIVPKDSHQTKMVGNRNWSPRYHDGKHKPKAKK